MEDTKQKSPILQWVENEVKLAYHHENPDWVEEQYDQATMKFNEIVKELNAIEDKDARIHRRNSIIKEIKNTSNPK